MSEFDPYPEMQHSLLPDFGSAMATKLQQKVGNFDPHAMMIQRKKEESGEVVRTPMTKSWDETALKDIETLENFCAQHGIVGFNCGRMSPVAALAFLKNKMGIADGPLESRAPAGYQPIWSQAKKYGPTLLHG